MTTTQAYQADDATAIIASTVSAQTPTIAVEPHVRTDTAFLDEWLPKLSGSAFKVLMALLRWKGDNLESHPRKATLMAQTGYSLATIERALKELIRLGLIKATPFFDERRDGRQDANRYLFLVEVHKVNPRPLSKKGASPTPRFRKPTTKKQREFDTAQQTPMSVAVHSQSEPAPLPQSPIPSLVERLISAGYGNAIKAAAFVEERPDVVERQIENLRRQRKHVPNPGGWLHTAITRDTPMAPLVEHKGPGTPKDGETVFLPECYARWVPSEPRKFDEPDKAPPPPQEEVVVVDEEEYESLDAAAEERSEACDEVFHALPREDQTFYLNFARELAIKEKSGEVEERRLLIWKDHKDAVEAALASAGESLP